MYILKDKIVTTRKNHNCMACGRIVPKRAKMRVQVNTYDGIGTWRECMTCNELLNQHFNHFVNPNSPEEYSNCVSEVLNNNQTPEELLIKLNETSTVN